MDSKENDLPTKYKLLQDVINQSSLHTKRKLGVISGNSYIGGCFLLVLALGISYFLNIFEYWIPAGFFLFFFLFFTALRSIRKPFIGKDATDIMRYYKEKHTDISVQIESSLQKNLAIIIQSLSIIYLISFFIIISIEYNWIVNVNTIETLLPAITCLLFIPVPFFIKELYQLTKPYEIKISLKKIIEKNKNDLLKSVFSWGFLKPFFFGFYFGLLILFPLVSIWITRVIIIQWSYVLLIFILQCFMVLLFANSFSANTVRKELTTTITNYADINYLISMAQIQKHYTTKEYQRLQTLYQSAKPYDFIIQDTFKFINYYMLVPNRFHLNEILQPTRENTTIAAAVSIQNSEKHPSYSSPVKKKQLPTPKPTPNFTKPFTTQPTLKTTKTEPDKIQQSDKVSLNTDEDIDGIKIGKTGILVYGPIMDNLSSEIKSSVKKRIRSVNTPFKVELARKNNEYGGAPGLVPVGTGGAQVNADILVFKDNITEHQALNMFYRMENHLEGTKKTYRKPKHPTSNMFVIKTLPNFYGIDKVFYLSLGRNISKVTPKKLAKLAIDSVFNADEGPDGFNYLMSLKKHDITTPMSELCEEEILNQTFSNSLLESRKKLEDINAIKSSIK